MSVGSRTPLVLYVDDEEQARKYFPRLLGERFDVVVAESADAAKSLAERYGERIGLVISDQRMPGDSGAQLLSWMRINHPLSVRILTTAFSDMDAAISAVNDGEIYRYILKPWNQRELPAIISQALQHHLLQRERHMLLRERMATLQHVIMLDRARTLAVLAAGLSNQLRNPLLALKTYLEQAPPTRSEPMVTSETGWDDLRSMAHEESRRAVSMVERIIERTAARGHVFQRGVALADLLAPALAWAEQRLPGRVTSSVPGDLPRLTADPAPLAALFTSLLGYLARGNLIGDGLHIEVRPSMVWGRSGVAIRLASRGGAWDQAGLASLFGAISGNGQGSDPDLDLIAGYFIVFHHSGSMLVQADTPHGPSIEVSLPFDPESEAPLQLPAQLRRDWLESIFAFPAIAHG